jgi:hypothetical protein
MLNSFTLKVTSPFACVGFVACICLYMLCFLLVNLDVSSLCMLVAPHVRVLCVEPLLHLGVSYLALERD